MTILSHTLGFPRIGLHRELKKAQENYWSGNITQQHLLETGRELRSRHWQQQKDAGVDILPVGDFAWYDHVLNTSMMLDNVPERHRNNADDSDIDTLFRICRGHALNNEPAAEMTKWFNTNYHYIVPEFTSGQQFRLGWTQLLDEVDEALALGHYVKPVMLGPVSYLWLGKVKGRAFNRLSLLPALLSVYRQILGELAKRGVDWVQIDEPALVLELPQEWCESYHNAYRSLQGQTKLLLTTYFDSIRHQLDIITVLPVQGLHVDLVTGDDDLAELHQRLPTEWVLSAGVINGRNIWRADLKSWFERLHFLVSKRELWIGSSCSLLHSPIDLNTETRMGEEVKSWFAFALQKCSELGLLCAALNEPNEEHQAALVRYSAPIRARDSSNQVHNPQVKMRLEKITAADSQRQKPYVVRAKLQHACFNLPTWPTTTIGSFPQTTEIRRLRLDFKRGRLDAECYRAGISEHIKQAIIEQERLGLDVLVHGEAERNDMVEYFGEHLDGFVFTQNGWVQSYGSRCVKPPIIIGDISRPEAITVEWARYAQSLTDKPVKGMLTGPVTILCWSFPREDVSCKIIAQQIALALRDEVSDLEQVGIGIIQIDEPALREGLPLKHSAWHDYLNWAVEAFRLSTAVVKDNTQIHTHMCYCEFNDIMDSIAALDADVITLETSRSDMELLEIFNEFDYPNEIGLGVYDIHSPSVPSEEWIISLLRKAAQHIPVERLWVNPDCGLKTRTWPETRLSLANMVTAARTLRKEKH
ncbi:MAG: cobalamin-independent homocysteine transmethylase [Sodalis sp. Psp]|nr:cobalamin-independent homocysteine transmethylase [Sodalis sp. Psp]MCR3756897.1 cobalamin-independent homocysteine transmethylase [Sodalis sp. Ppy]